MSFVKALRSSRSELAAVVTAKDRLGSPIWYLLLLDKNRLPIFDVDIKKNKVISPREYGEVLLSGYGKSIPESRLNKIPENIRKLFANLV